MQYINHTRKYLRHRDFSNLLDFLIVHIHTIHVSIRSLPSAPRLFASLSRGNHGSCSPDLDVRGPGRTIILFGSAHASRLQICFQGLAPSSGFVGDKSLKRRRRSCGPSSAIVDAHNRQNNQVLVRLSMNTFFSRNAVFALFEIRIGDPGKVDGASFSYRQSNSHTSPASFFQFVRLRSTASAHHFMSSSDVG